MKRTLFVLVGFLFIAPIVAFAIQVTVPSSTQYGQVLIGNASGGNYTPVATSTLGISGGSGGTGTVSTSSIPTVGQLAYWTSNGFPSLLGSVATSSPTFSSPLTTSGTAGYIVGGSAFTIGCQTASGSQAGCLSSSDWTTFNNKQVAGNYITALTGDGTASGPGSSAFTLATVNGNVGSFTNANITVNAKGLITAAANGTGGSASSTLLSDNNMWTGTNTYNVSPTIGVNTNGILLGGLTWAYASTTNQDTIFGIQSGGGLATTSATVKSLTLFGYLAGQKLTTGGNNSAFGEQTLQNDLTGTDNTAVGYQALATYAGSQNTAIGSDSLPFATGNDNTAVGYFSGESVNSGTNNTAIGWESLLLNTSGGSNTAVGYQALGGNNTGSSNTAIGFEAGVAGASQDYENNTFIGYRTNEGPGGRIVDTTELGYEAGFNNTGWDSTFLGELSGQNVTSGNNNILIGFNALAPSATASNQLNLGNIVFASNLAATSSSSSVIPTITGNITVGTSTFSGTSFFIVASTSANAFAVQNSNGTNILNVNTQTPNTNNPIFQIQATSSSDTLFQVDQYGHLTASSTKATPTVSCSPSGGTISANSNDVTGTITTGTLSTSCTITFGSAYSIAPMVFVQQAGTASILGVSAVSTTAFTISLGTSATGDAISYFAIMP